MKLDLLTNATVVDDAIRFVSSNRSDEKPKSANNSNECDREESNEPDYEGKDQLEKEQQGSKLMTTRNALF